MSVKNYRDTTHTAIVANDDDTLVIQQGGNLSTSESTGIMKQVTLQELREPLVRTSSLGSTVATLTGGKVTTSQLPSYIDEIIECYISSTGTAFTEDWLEDDQGATLTPETSKIYLIKTTGTYFNRVYRWSNSIYVEIATGNKEELNNKTYSVDDSSTDVQYPSAKAVYNDVYKALNDTKIDQAEIDENDDNALVLSANGVELYRIRGVGGGGGGGGGTSTSTVTVINNSGFSKKTVTASSSVTLKFNWNSKKSGTVISGSGTMTISINGTVKVTQEVEQGDIEYELPASLLTVGKSNTVMVKVTNDYSAYDWFSVAISVVNLGLTSSFNCDTIRTANKFNFGYVPKASGTKQMIFTVDGVLQQDSPVITTEGTEESYEFKNLTQGNHVITAQYSLTIEDALVYSDKLVYDVAVLLDDTTVSDPIITCQYFNTSLTQYDVITVKYMVVTPGTQKSTITVSDNHGWSKTYVDISRDAQTFEYTASTYGTLKLSLKSGNTTKKLQDITVTQNQGVPEAVSSDMSLFLSSKDRSNNDPDKNIWTYTNYKSQTITSTFNNFSWGTTDGWLADSDGITALKVTGGATVEIDYKMFERDFTDTGKTLEIEFSTQDVVDYNSIIMKCFGGTDTSGVGYTLTSHKMNFNGLTTKTGDILYKENEHIRLAITIQDISSSLRLVMTYINGIASGAVMYDASAINEFKQTTPQNIIIGNSNATINIYSIRVYDKYLNQTDILGNWIADTRNNTLKMERYTRNAEYLSSKLIEPGKLGTNVPYMIIEYDGELPKAKTDQKVTVSGSYTDPLNTDKCFTFIGAKLGVQGTSSVEYAIKNWKIDFSKGGILRPGHTDREYTYQLSDDSIPVGLFCLKADVASSEGCNNVELVSLYDRVSPFQTPPQKEEESKWGGKVRQGVEGYPIVVFLKKNGVTSLLGKYNFNNDKSTEKVFGFETGDESWEFLNNTEPRTRFQSADFSSSALTPWTEDIEARYPEDSTEITNLKAFMEWVVSTDTKYEKIYNEETKKWSNSVWPVWADEKTATPSYQPYIYNTRVMNYDSGSSNITYGTPVEDLFTLEDGVYKKQIPGAIAQSGITYYSKYHGNAFTSATSGATQGTFKVWSNSDPTVDPPYETDGKTYEEITCYYKTINNVKYREDNRAYRLAKFYSELKDHANVDGMVYNFLFTEVFLMVDNRAKNIFPTMYGDDGKWCILPYDFDTALGYNNTGELAYGYKYESTDNMVIGDLTTESVYNDQAESVLYSNIRMAFAAELRTMYSELVTTKNFNFETINQKFTEHQAYWSEGLFNEDAWVKYINPITAGTGKVTHLKMLQGSKDEQRKWWLSNRMSYFDSKYFVDTDEDHIDLRINGAVPITIEPYADIYASIKWGSRVAQQRALKSDSEEGTKTYTFECPLVSPRNTEVYIYNSSKLLSISDLSDLKCTKAAFDHAVNLKEIKIGNSDASYSNPELTSVSIGKNTLLRKLDISNCTNLGKEQGTIDVSNCTNLEELYLGGTSVKSVAFPTTGTLKKVVLPNTITSFTLINQPNITEATIPTLSNLTVLRLENNNKVLDSVALLQQVKDGGSVRVDDFDLTVSSVSEIEALITKLGSLDGIDSTGKAVDDPRIWGTIHIDTITYSEKVRLQNLLNGIIIGEGAGITITATYLRCSVNFYDYLQESVLYNTIVDAGDSVSYIGDTPTRERDTEYRYVYDEQWTDLTRTQIIDLSNVQENLNLCPHFTAIPIVTYTFYDENDVVYADATRTVDKGTDISYTDPTKASDPQYDYTFNGWYNQARTERISLTNVQTTQNVYAKFDAHLRSYEVKFVNATYPKDSANYLLETKIVNYGEMAEYTGTITPVYNPAAPDAGDWGAWVPENGWYPVLSTVTGAVTYYAKFPYIAELTVPLVQGTNTTANMVDLETVGDHGFAYCTNLSFVSLPNLNTIDTYGFAYCTALSSANIPACTTINNSAFYNCTNLSSVYLGSVCTLASMDAFSKTGIWETKGSIFVPSSCVETYKVSDVWSSFSDRIYGY